MITLKQEEKLIDRLKELTELEMLSILEELSDHIYKNGLHEMASKALDVFDYREENQELDEEIERLRDEVSDLKEQLEDAEMKLTVNDLTDEDNLASHLSMMSPMDYSSLMSKVNRDGWQMTGFKTKPFRKQ